MRRGKIKLVTVRNGKHWSKCSSANGALQHGFLQLRHHHEITMKKLNRDMGVYLELSGQDQNEALQRQRQKNIKRVRNLRRE